MAIPLELLRDIDKLDPLPVTVQRLMGMMGEEVVSPREIAQAVEFDQVIAGTLLRVANSPIMGGRGSIGRVADAVMRLGVDQILNIALGSHMKKISRPAEMYDLSENELWLHGALSSVAAKEIIAHCPQVEISELAPIAALTHDVGKLILVRHAGVRPEEVLETAQKRGLTFVETERELLGFDHAELGGAVAEKWEFPEEVRDAIARHHTVPLEDPNPLLDTVMMSNWVAKTVGVGVGAEGMNFNVDEGISKRLGLGYQDFATICSRVADLMRDLKDVYRENEARVPR